jgi:hypothetical protein
MASELFITLGKFKMQVGIIVGMAKRAKKESAEEQRRVMLVILRSVKNLKKRIDEMKEEFLINNDTDFEAIVQLVGKKVIAALRPDKKRDNTQKLLDALDYVAGLDPATLTADLQIAQGKSSGLGRSISSELKKAA